MLQKIILIFDECTSGFRESFGGLHLNHSVNPDLCLFGDGEEMNLCVTDKKNETSNNFSVKVGNTDQNFCHCFRVENLKLLAGAYDVSISSKSVALFQGKGIKYYIALEPNA